MKNPDKLRVTPESEDLAILVYQYTTAFPREERYVLAAQMRRAAGSIGSNIFEGCGRLTDAGFVASLGVSHSEACELLFQARLAVRLGFGDPKLGERVKRKTGHVRRMIFNLIRRFDEHGE